MGYVGLDIGGANLKVAHANGTAILQPFELWKNPAGLADALRGLLSRLPAYDGLVVTMTGELCDCFESKRQGVNAILDAVEAVRGSTPVLVWQTDGQFVNLPNARERPQHTAAANWLALATFAGRFAPSGYALLIDIGSTTTDIVLLHDGQPRPRGRTDSERLRCGELVYTGVRRTPVCAVLGSSGAAELFATTLDAYLVLNKLAEDPADCSTADGRPATKAAAHARLARMLCTDLETSAEADRNELAERICNQQVRMIRRAIERVSSAIDGPIETVALGGSGEFLAPSVLTGRPEPLRRIAATAKVVSLADQLGPAISQAACAYAVAVLAGERAPS
jgi:probable H4MPT-linked C1 transfer pathway protein